MKSQNNIEVLTQGSSVEPDDYPEWFFPYLFEVEKRHFWHAGRTNAIVRYIETYKPDRQRLTYLEIGCGSGYVVAAVESLGGIEATGLDMSLTGLSLARKRTKCRLVRADIFKHDLIETYDLLGLFDVLEHIEDDINFLKASSSYLKKNGRIFITVPAREELWSDVDIASSHKRRYTLKTLKETITQSNLKIINMSYFGFCIYPLMKLSRRNSEDKFTKEMKLQILKKSLSVPNPLINKLLKNAFILETNRIPLTHYPLGTSIIAVCDRYQSTAL